MTTEIEKELFEKYGAEPNIENNCLNHHNFNNYEYDLCEQMNNNCSNCHKNYVHTSYPPITAEKILKLFEIIKKYCLRCGVKDIVILTKIDFSEQLFKYFTCVKDLTPQEQNEVKSILES